MVGFHARLQQAFALHDAGKYEQAAQLFLSLSQQAPAVRALAARSLMETGDLASAYEQAQLAVKEVGSLGVTHFMLALVAERRGQLDTAMSEYQTVLALDPTNGAAHNNLGGIQYLRENFGDARAETEAALRLETDAEGTAISLANLAEFDALDNQLPAAEQKLNESLEANPESAVAYFGLASLYDVTGRTQAAVTMEKNALELDPHGALQRASSYVYPELKLESEALAAEAQGNRAVAVERWTTLEQLELSAGLHWTSMKGLATKHLAQLSAQFTADGAARVIAPEIAARSVELPLATMTERAATTGTLLGR
jgi:Tfp pilus assembly protein PilF